MLPDNSLASVLQLHHPDLPIEGVAPPVDPMLHTPPDAPPPALPIPPLPDAIPAPVPIILASPHLVPVVCLSPLPMDLPERPRTPTEVQKLLSNYKHHLSTDPLPAKCTSQVWLPGMLAEDTNSSTKSDTCILLLDAIECVFSTSSDLEPRTLHDALSCTDAPKWVEAALKEIKAHIQNGTWELAQLLPGKCAIGSRWVFKIKRTPEGLVDKYKARLVAQGFSQIPGIHYREVFALTARFTVVRTVIALAANEDLELESVDISTAFLNGEINKEVYMHIPDGFKVKGEPRDGEDPKRWVVQLLK